MALPFWIFGLENRLSTGFDWQRMGKENASLKQRWCVRLQNLEIFQFIVSLFSSWLETKPTTKNLHPLGSRDGILSMEPNCVFLVRDCLMCNHWHCKIMALSWLLRFVFPRCVFLLIDESFLNVCSYYVDCSKLSWVCFVILGELKDLNFPLVIILLEYIKLWKQILQCSKFFEMYTIYFRLARIFFLNLGAFWWNILDIVTG